MTKAVWHPSEEGMRSTRMYQLMQKLGFASYDEFYRRSVEDIAWFWHEVVTDMNIRWDTPYSETLDLSRGVRWPHWFVGGKLNVTTNALDVWAQNPDTADRAALIWEGEDGAVRRYTYRELTDKVDRAAAGLRGLGVDPGDRVAIYMPMIPETVIAMLAVMKIGAIVVPNFSGYGADAVRTRIKGSAAKLLVTADGYLRRGKVIPMKETADEAARACASIANVVVVRRTGRDIPWDDARDVDWTRLEQAPAGESAASMASDDPLMIMYTSGTTGRPKGTVHTHSGFPIKSAFDAGYGMDVQQGDVMYWVTDMGWMMGPFLVFATLLNGATMVVYEGTPDYPAPNRLWKMVESHKVTHLGISPTLVRAMISHGTAPLDGIDLSSLRLIGSTGEPWNPEPWHWLFEQVCKRKIPIFNYSGGTEISGGILGNVLLRPISPITFSGPFPGMDADVFDSEGRSVRGEVGELVVRQPWVGMTNGFWKEPERYEKTYWSRWPNIWVHGDWVDVDEEGFWTITGRSDDTLNVAGKRLGPTEIESILVDHSEVIEAATIGVPDPVKGEAAVCFVVLLGQSTDASPTGLLPPQLRKELFSMVDKSLGKALRPKEIYAVKELPKTRNGKVMRRVIRAAFLALDTGDVSSLDNPRVLEEIRELGSHGGEGGE